MSYEAEQFIESFDDIRQAYLNMIRKCEIYESALEAADGWSVPTAETTEGSFAYIPCLLSEFSDLIVELAEVLPDDPDFRHSRQPIRPLTFVEVGCGIGRNLNMMRAQGLVPIAKAVGFDVIPDYVETARRLHGFGENVFVQDAMTFDYAGFDLVFFYRPFSDGAMQIAFEEHLMDSVKPGAIIIGLTVEVLDSSRRVVQVGTSGSLYKKL